MSRLFKTQRVGGISHALCFNPRTLPWEGVREERPFAVWGAGAYTRTSTSLRHRTRRCSMAAARCCPARSATASWSCRWTTSPTRSCTPSWRSATASPPGRAHPVSRPKNKCDSMRKLFRISEQASQKSWLQMKFAMDHLYGKNEFA